MKNTRITHTLLAAALLAMLAACSSSDSSASTEGTTTIKSPISLYRTSATSALKKSVGITDAMTPEEYDIDLDTVRTTTEFWFIIVNNDSSDITGMKITSDNDAFVVTPDTMVTLSPFDGDDLGMIQMMKVTVEHGTAASGLANANLLTGDQYADITITGTVSGDTFSTTYAMHAYAKRMVIYIDTLADTALYAKALVPGYVYVDSLSEDCYATSMESSGETVTVGLADYSRRFTGIGEALDTALVAGLCYGLSCYVVKDSALYDTLYTELTAYSDFASGELSDYSCATLIINNANTGTNSWTQKLHN